MTQIHQPSLERRGQRTFIRHEHLVATARTGPHDELSIAEILTLAPELLHRDGDRHGRSARAKRGCIKILEWLATFPGSGWQQRWLNSGADAGIAWMEKLAAEDPRVDETARDDMRMGMGYLLACQVVLPGYDYLNACHLFGAMDTVRRVITPDLFTRSVIAADQVGILGKPRGEALNVLTKIVMHTGKGLDQVTETDLFEYRSSAQRAKGVHAAWQILAAMGVLAEDSTMRAALHVGQPSTGDLVTGIRSRTRPSATSSCATWKSSGPAWTTPLSARWSRTCARTSGATSNYTIRESARCACRETSMRAGGNGSTGSI